MSRRRRKEKKKIILNQPAGQVNKFTNQEKVEGGVVLLELGPGVKISLPFTKGLKTKQNKEKKNLYCLFLSSPGKTLSIWLDLEFGEKIIYIGDKNYLARGGKLIEVIEPGGWDFIYKKFPKKEGFPLQIGSSGEVIVDLQKIKGNKKLDEFLSK